MKNILYWIVAAAVATGIYSLIVGVYGCYPRGAPNNAGWALLFFPFNIIMIGLPAFLGGVFLTSVLNRLAPCNGEGILRMRAMTAIVIVGCIVLISLMLVFAHTPDNCVI